ncbi:selenoprotein K-like isoform X2 [Homarus americanus]|uniref:selenoprotein K-like isoform X2 n=1 Tax=Homarus americanus TaxID=6706 RepID=UPI001C478D7D|nr:selenoprotein K-like isoform X2 [Homarus americanus]
MPYISSGGNIGGQREWGLSTIPNLFWGFINFIVLFFQTLVNPDLTKRGNSYASDYSAPGRGPPPGPPRRRMGGLHRSGGAGPPPMAGGG